MEKATVVMHEKTGERIAFLITKAEGQSLFEGSTKKLVQLRFGRKARGERMEGQENTIIVVVDKRLDVLFGHGHLNVVADAHSETLCC